MTYKLACELSNRFAAVAAVSGGFFHSNKQDCDPSLPIPLLQIRGTDDQIVPVNGSPYYPSSDITLDYFSEKNDCLQVDTIELADLVASDGSTVTKTSYTDCIGQNEIVYFKITGGGHTWPGVEFVVGERFGNRNMDINASNEILNFFDNFTLN